MEIIVDTKGRRISNKLSAAIEHAQLQTDAAMLIMLKDQNWEFAVRGAVLFAMTNARKGDSFATWTLEEMEQAAWYEFVRQAIEMGTEEVRRKGVVLDLPAMIAIVDAKNGEFLLGDDRSIASKAQVTEILEALNIMKRRSVRWPLYTRSTPD